MTRNTNTSTSTSTSTDTSTGTGTSANTDTSTNANRRLRSLSALPARTAIGTAAGRIAPALLALALAVPASARGSLPPEGHGRPSIGLLASGPRRAEVVSGEGAARPTARDPAPGPRRVPDDVLHDPAERMRFMERMRVQILHRTRGVSPADYDRVRPGLGRQLRAMGLLEDEAELVLADVERSRAGAAGNLL